jgi:hypothetical protein
MTANKKPREGYVTWMQIHPNIEEAESWVPKSEHEDLLFVREVLPGEITDTIRLDWVLRHGPKVILGEWEYLFDERDDIDSAMKEGSDE